MVVDATTGQNAIRQAEVFRDAIEVTGIVLAKLDGTAKGGIILAIKEELGIPVKLVGVGEASEDLKDFSGEEFLTALFGEEEKMMKIGIIGGTGFYEPGIINEEKDLTTSTPYGPASLKTGDYKEREVVFLSRHGARHTVPPHLVNYRANIWALREIGVEKVIATATVGSLQKDLRPGEIMLIDQFLDFTKSRATDIF